MFTLQLIPDVGRSQSVKPRHEPRSADAVLQLGIHNARMLLIEKPWMGKIEVVVIRESDREAVRHEIVRPDAKENDLR